MTRPVGVSPGAAPAVIGIIDPGSFAGAEMAGFGATLGDADWNEPVAVEARTSIPGGDADVIVIPMTPGAAVQRPSTAPAAVPLLSIGMAVFSWFERLSSWLSKKGGEIQPTGQVTGEAMRLPTRDGDRLRIGREPQPQEGVETFEISGDMLLSANHADIVRRSDGYYVEDLGSMNGTLIMRNGEVLPVGTQPVKLSDGDRLILANDANAFDIAIRGYAPAEDALIAGNLSVNLWVLDLRGRTSTIFGNKRGAGVIRIDDASVDDHHARLALASDGYRLKSLETRLGTAVIDSDGHPVPMGRGNSILLGAGARVIVGRVVVHVIDEATARMRELWQGDARGTMPLPVDVDPPVMRSDHPEGYRAKPMRGNEARAAAARARSGERGNSLRTQFLPSDEVQPPLQEERGRRRMVVTPSPASGSTAGRTAANVRPIVDDEDDEGPLKAADQTRARDGDILEVSPTERHAIVRGHRAVRRPPLQEKEGEETRMPAFRPPSGKKR